MNNEFREEIWSEKRLERLLGCMESVANWKYHSCKVLNDDAILNLLLIQNSRWMAMVLKIIRVISKHKSTAQDIWDCVFPEIKANELCSLFTIEMLSICAEAGAQSTDKQLRLIRSGANAYTRNVEWAEPYMKILVSSIKEKNRVTHYMSFLGEFYIVPPKLVQLARELVHLMYKTWDECFESRQLISCFLFLTNEQEMLNDEVIEESTCANWMRRSPLHLAVIFLDSLELLSHGMIEKYIEARDVHGCTPLHLAYLHQNEHAVTFLMGYVKDDISTDHFGLTPAHMLSSIGDEIKKKYYEHCREVLEAKKEVMKLLKLLKPMIVMPVDEAEELINELKILFERLIHETKFKKAQIQLAGSMRERTKCGILDEADIQIRLNNEILLDEEQQMGIMQELAFALREALANISWEGIFLRPIDVSGPWILIREGTGGTGGMQINLDVVLILISDASKVRVSLRSQRVIRAGSLSKPKMSNENYEDSEEWLHDIIKGNPLHKPMFFVTLEPWNKNKKLKRTMFAPEWNIIDSLPMPCKLATLITKALVQAYDCVRGHSMCVKMPITSYMIKTAVFFLLVYDESSQFSNQHARRADLEEALEKVKGKHRRTEKLSFDQNSKWVKDEDLQEHREEARVWAQDIFLLFKFLAQRKLTLTSYWSRRSFYICAELDLGQAEYTLELCDCSLQKLKKNAF